MTEAKASDIETIAAQRPTAGRPSGSLGSAFGTRVGLALLLAVIGLAPEEVAAQDPAHQAEGTLRRSGPEIAVGLFEHGSNFHPLGDRLVLAPAPAGFIYEENEEAVGTVDVQLAYRSLPLGFALRPRLTGKLQISTAGRTSFASAGAEWRQHLLRGRVYGQIGIGLTIHDGYRFTPDPFEPGLSAVEVRRRYDIYLTRTSFGSRVLFNPNVSFGVRLNPKWAVEVAWEHFSHRRVFSKMNPGLDNLGLRLVRTLGRR